MVEPFNWFRLQIAMTTVWLTYTWAKDNEFQPECTVMALNDLLPCVAYCLKKENKCIKAGQNNGSVEIHRDTGHKAQNQDCPG